MFVVAQRTQRIHAQLSKQQYGMQSFRTSIGAIAVAHRTAKHTHSFPNTTAALSRNTLAEGTLTIVVVDSESQIVMFGLHSVITVLR